MHCVLTIQSQFFPYHIFDPLHPLLPPPPLFPLVTTILFVSVSVNFCLFVAFSFTRKIVSSPEEIQPSIPLFFISRGWILS